MLRYPSSDFGSSSFLVLPFDTFVCLLHQLFCKPAVGLLEFAPISVANQTKISNTWYMMGVDLSLDPRNYNGLLVSNKTWWWFSSLS